MGRFDNISLSTVTIGLVHPTHFDPEDGGRMYLRTVINTVHIHTVQNQHALGFIRNVFCGLSSSCRHICLKVGHDRFLPHTVRFTNGPVILTLRSERRQALEDTKISMTLVTSFDSEGIVSQRICSSRLRASKWKYRLIWLEEFVE
jgi:hypothetical protein